MPSYNAVNYRKVCMTRLLAFVKKWNDDEGKRTNTHLLERTDPNYAETNEVLITLREGSDMDGVTIKTAEIDLSLPWGDVHKGNYDAVRVHVIMLDGMKS